MTTLAGNLQPSTTGSTPSAKPITEATPRQVQQWLRSGETVLIDVREPDEHAREHIAGSRLIPLSRFDAAQAASCAKPGQRIALHCRSGMRSMDASRRLRAVAEPPLSRAVATC